jgi:Bacterial Ig-like domain (group 3)
VGGTVVVALGHGREEDRTMRGRVTSFVAFRVNSAVVRFSLALGMALVASVASGQTTFTNSSSTATTTNGTSATQASPYPSTITVPGSFTGTVSTISVVLHGLTTDGNTRNSLAFSGLVLVAPSGKSMEILGGAGDGTDAGPGLTNVKVTIQDGGTAVLPPNNLSISAGDKVWKPSSYGAAADPEPHSYITIGTPQFFATTQGSATMNSVFVGETAAGTWKLYLEAFKGDPVSFSSWDLVLTAVSASGTTTVVSSTQNPTFTTSPTNSATITATVTSGSTVNAGTVGFTDNGVAIAGCTAQAVSNGSASCVHTFASEGNRPIIATYSGGGTFAGSTSTIFIQVVRTHSSNPTTNKYCNTTSLLATGFPSTQLIYPSYLEVPAITNTIANVSISLNGLQGTTGLGAGQFLLVSPGGHNLDFLSHVGFSGSQGSVNGTIADNNPSAPISGTFPSGFLFEPTDQHNQTDTFGAAPVPNPQPPASLNLAQPSPNSQTLLQAFNGINTQGDWLLYLYDNLGSGSDITLASGWCLTFTMNTGNPSTTTITSNHNPARPSPAVAFTATVKDGSNNPITSGTVSFTENGSLVPGGTNPVTLNGSGQAAFTPTTLTEGDHTILATFNPVATFNSSNASLVQRMDNNSTIVSPVGNTVSFCNTGQILIPAQSGGAFNSGAAKPNPSNVFAAQLPGITSTVGVTLKNFSTSTTLPNFIQSLLVGPGAANANTLDFFSGTGGAGTFVPLGNYSFKDSAAGLVPQSNFSAGSYKPTSYSQGGPDTFFQSASTAFTLPTGPYQYAATVGTKTFTNTYGGLDGNGTWSLYFNQNIHADNSGASGGWCMDFTQTAPTITATKGPNALHVIQGDTGDGITIDVHNAGPGGAGGAIPLKVTDNFPSGLTPTGGSGTNWSCSAPIAQTITCSSTDFIASGSNFPTLTINFNVAANATAPATVNNSAVITGSALTSGVNSNTLTITVDPAPDVTVTAGHTGTFTQGSTGTLTITGHNIVASSKTHGTTTVVDTMPTGWTLNSFNGGTWTCGSLTNVVTCTTSDQVTGVADYSVLNLIANVPANSAVSVSHSVTISGGGELSTSTANDSSSDNLTVIQVPASIVANASTTPQTATVNTAFTNALAVTVKDAGSVVIPGANVTFLAPGSGASGKFSNNTQTITVATNASGISSAPFTANTTAGGPYNVSATVGALAAINFSLTNNAGAATQMAANAGTTPQSATISTAFANPLAVTVKDTFNNAVAGVSVTFTAPGSGASGKFSNNTATITVATDASGVASAPFTANTVAGGPYTVTAASAGLTTVNFSLTNTAGPASSMTANAGTTPQSATISTAFANALGVTIKDASNNPVSGVNVTFTAPGSGASGTFSNATGTITVATNASGVASAPFTANSAAGGPYNVTAASSGLTTVNFSLTNTAGAASSMTANAGTTPQTATVGTAFANPLAVTVKDGGNNPVSGVSVTFTAPGSGASGTFSNATATITVVTNASGVASAPFNANATAGGAYTVTAMASALTTVNFSLTNSAVPVNTMTANPGTTPQSANVTTAFANALAVTILDPNALPVVGVNVTFSAPGSGPSGTFSNATNTITVATNASGVASAPFTANATAGGPYTVTATAGALTVNFSLTNTLLGSPAPDVTAQFTVAPGGLTFNRTTGKYSLPILLTNNGPSLSAVAFVLDNLSAGNTVVTPSGTTSATTPVGSPYVEIGPIASGASIVFVIPFTHTGTLAITDTPRLLGPGLR